MSEKSQIIAQARREGRGILTEIEAKKVLREAGIPVVEAFLAHSRREAVEIASGLGFPVVLKIASPDITHKSDIGGVRVGLRSKTEVSRAYGEIIGAARGKYPAARIDGVSVQKMASSGLEVIIGVTRDAQFGPVIM
ncbi:MAG: acetate--CoA ligase family protein, partial [Dehalococcoidales bacterium]|nr:acetate--CoA ligase family protein [Dehalococcoidales bacterium]